jgi:hypothetical protein
MSASNLTFEEVDKHIQSADLSAFQPGGKSYLSATAAASLAAAIPNVCGAYQVIRPILALIANLPLIPKKWKDAIKVFMQVMDTLCPQNPKRKIAKQRSSRPFEPFKVVWFR